MSTTIRPEISEGNKYWIDRHRYYELKHFCMQYPLWKKAYATLDGMSKTPIDPVISATGHGDPTARCAEKKELYSDRIEMIIRVAKETDLAMWDYILKGVTEGFSYDHLKARLDIPCCKSVYYDLYRRFFWLLDKARN